ncbi:surfeit locus 1 family protein [Oxalobacteraceae bacterium GrIS 2.11]
MPAFHFRLVPFIATLLLIALGCSLSYWQTQRAHQKEVIEAKLQNREKIPAIPLPETVDVSQMEYVRVILNGEFEPGWAIYLDNRPMNGMAGIDVIMPFKLHNQNKYVLVARGWVPRNNLDRSEVRHYETPAGTVQIEGSIKAHNDRVFQFGPTAALQAKTLIQNFDIAEFEQASKLPVYPFIIEQTQNIDDGLLRDWPRASMGSERHRGYAFQWLALAVMALLFFLATNFSKRDGSKRG